MGSGSHRPQVGNRGRGRPGPRVFGCRGRPRLFQRGVARRGQRPGSVQLLPGPSHDRTLRRATASRGAILDPESGVEHGHHQGRLHPDHPDVVSAGDRRHRVLHLRLAPDCVGAGSEARPAHDSAHSRDAPPRRCRVGSPRGSPRPRQKTKHPDRLRRLHRVWHPESGLPRRD